MAREESRAQGSGAGGCGFATTLGLECQGTRGPSDVIKRLADDIQWTTDLANAFLAQQKDVMDAVQRMRAKARAKGNLSSNQQQTVVQAPVPDRCLRSTAAPVKAAVRRALVVAPTASAAETSPAAQAPEAAAAPEAMREAAMLLEGAAMDLPTRVRAPRAAEDPASWDQGAAGDDAAELARGRSHVRSDR